MQDFRLKVLDAFRKELDEQVKRAQLEGRAIDIIGYKQVIKKVDEKSDELKKDDEEFLKEIGKLEKTYTPPQNSPIWNMTQKAVEAINSANPHKIITMPKNILVMPAAEMIQIDGSPPAMYSSIADVMVIEKGVAITPQMIAHELTHKQQAMYDEVPDLSKVTDMPSLKKLLKERGLKNETLADIGSAKAYPNGNNEVDNLKNILKDELLYGLAEVEAKRCDIEKTVNDITLALQMVHVPNEQILHLKQIFAFNGYDAWKNETMEIAVNVPEPTHPSIEQRHFIVQKELDTHLFGRLGSVANEANIIANWQKEFEESQPKKPTNTEILEDIRQQPKVESIFYDAVVIVPPSASLPNNSVVKRL